VVFEEQRGGGEGIAGVVAVHDAVVVGVDAVAASAQAVGVG
jgi:hypothetical protein